MWNDVAEVEGVPVDLLIAGDLDPRRILAHSAPTKDFPVPFDNLVNVPWSGKGCTYPEGLV